MYVRGRVENGRIQLLEPLEYPEGTILLLKIRTREDLLEIREWNISSNDYLNLTPKKALYVMTRCFIYAHLEEVIAAKSRRLTYDDYDQVKDSLIAEIKLSFRQVQEDINKPSKSGLFKVLNLLSEKQINRGAPAGIINNHRSQLSKLFDTL